MGKVNARDMRKNEFVKELEQYRLEDGRWRVFVKPYTAELKKELEDYKKLKLQSDEITVTEKDGTYCITTSDSIYEVLDLRYTLWFMIFLRMRSEARNTLAMEVIGYSTRKLHWSENDLDMPYDDKNKDNYYYVASIAPEFITEKTPRFYVAA